MVQLRGKKGLLSKITSTLLKKGEVEGDAMEEAVFSLMTPEMIPPVGKPVSVSRAVQVYKKYMLSVGYLEKDDIADFVRSLKEDMAEREAELKYEIKNSKEQVVEAKAEVKSLKKQFSKCKDDDDREYVQEELDRATADLVEETATYEQFVADLSLFKKDKRMFLLDYINSEIHGDDWRDK
ncbi:hypothetical protein [Desulforhopalus sp. 52FAK]